MLPSLKRNNKLFINNYIEDFETMLVLIEYYDYVLKGVNKKIAEDLQKDIVKENINPLIKSLTHFLKDFLISSQIFELEIKRLVYNAQFTNAYTKLENVLLELCDDPDGLKNIKAKNELQRTVKYLKKKLNMNTVKFNELYSKIDKYRETRNLIVHMNIKHKNIKKEDIDSRLVYSSNELYINNSSYIVDFLNTSKEFISIILKEYNDRK